MSCVIQTSVCTLTRFVLFVCEYVAIAATVAVGWVHSLCRQVVDDVMVCVM